jgi:GNAT superfamily N-acetyltransferase
MSPKQITTQVILSSVKESVSADELLCLYRECGWMTPEQSAEMVATVLEFTDAVVSARTESGTLIGFAKILTDRLLYTTVAEVLIHPDYRRQGVGREIMRQVEADWGHTPIFIAAFEYNREFFEACGYSVRPNMLVASKLFPP